MIKDNKTGFLSTMPTTDELTHSLEVALTKKATWQALGDAGRQAVKQSFSMEAMAQNYADIYRQVKEMRE